MILLSCLLAAESLLLSLPEGAEDLRGGIDSAGWWVSYKIGDSAFTVINGKTYHHKAERVAFLSDGDVAYSFPKKKAGSFLFLRDTLLGPFRSVSEFAISREGLFACGIAETVYNPHRGCAWALPWNWRYWNRGLVISYGVIYETSPRDFIISKGFRWVWGPWWNGEKVYFKGEKGKDLVVVGTKPQKEPGPKLYEIRKDTGRVFWIKVAEDWEGPYTGSLSSMRCFSPVGRRDQILVNPDGRYAYAVDVGTLMEPREVLVVNGQVIDTFNAIINLFAFGPDSLWAAVVDTFVVVKNSPVIGRQIITSTLILNGDTVARHDHIGNLGFDSDGGLVYCFMKERKYYLCVPKGTLGPYESVVDLRIDEAGNYWAIGYSDKDWGSECEVIFNGQVIGTYQRVFTSERRSEVPCRFLGIKDRGVWLVVP